MKRKLLSVLLCILLLCTFAVSAFAVQTTNNGLPLVVDNADLLSADEEYELSVQLYTIGTQYAVDLVVLTVPSLNGKTSLEYADDYFDYMGYGQGDERSGMLLLYLPGPQGERDIALSTRGSLYECVSDADSDAMLDTLIPDLINENYVSAFDSFVEFSKEECAQIGKTKTLPLYYIPLCLLIGFAAAFIILKIQTASLKSVKPQKNARFYIQENSLMLTGSSDRFLYKNVTKTAKQQASSSSSGGRTSSSGATHGGTSKKF